MIHFQINDLRPDPIDLGSLILSPGSDYALIMPSHMAVPLRELKVEQGNDVG